MSWLDAQGQFPNSPKILIGAHWDPVGIAGQFDRMLGVLAAIAAVDQLNKENIRAPLAADGWKFRCVFTDTTWGTECVLR